MIRQEDNNGFLVLFLICFLWWFANKLLIKIIGHECTVATKERWRQHNQLVLPLDNTLTFAFLSINLKCKN